MKQKLLHHIVGNKDVGKSVAIIVGKCHTEAISLFPCDTGFYTHIFKRAVAAVVVEDIADWRKFSWRTVLAYNQPTRLAVPHVPVQIAGHEQVQFAIVVIVKKSRRDRPAAASNASLCGDIRKGSVAVVVIKNVFRIVRDENIRIAIIVIIAPGAAHAIISVACIFQPSFLGHVGETAIAILPVESVPVAWVVTIEIIRWLHWAGNSATIHKKDVQEAIIVIVEKRHASRHSFNQVLERGGRVFQSEIHATRKSYVKDGHGGWSRQAHGCYGQAQCCQSNRDASTLAVGRPHDCGRGALRSVEAG